MVSANLANYYWEFVSTEAMLWPILMHRKSKYTHVDKYGGTPIEH